MIEKMVMLAGMPRKVQFRKKKKSRLVRIHVASSQLITVTMPCRCSFHEALQFVLKKQQWIERQCRLFEQGIVILQKEPFAVVKARTHKRIHQVAAYYARLMGVQYKRIIVKRYKSRWGSCSHDGHLSFNYRLGLLPDEILRYVVIHELAHLKEFNHSSRFWALVQDQCPAYEQIRRLMKYVIIG